MFDVAIFIESLNKREAQLDEAKEIIKRIAEKESSLASDIQKLSEKTVEQLKKDNPSIVHLLRR